MEWLMSITHRGKYDLLVKSRILFAVRKGFSDYGSSFTAAAVDSLQYDGRACGWARVPSAHTLVQRQVRMSLLFKADLVKVYCAAHMFPFEGNLKEIKAG
jgi:hypothetical protein